MQPNMSQTLVCHHECNDWNLHLRHSERTRCTLQWGMVCSLLSAISIIYLNLNRYSDYFPMQDSRSYDNTGHKYNVSRILTSNLEFSEDLYKAYSPLFLSTTFALAYGISFASIAAVIVHTAL